MAGHPIFASLYDRMLAGAERAGLAERRAAVVSRASGATLELGAGTGHNLGHYGPAVTSLTLTEPDPHMAARLRARLSDQPPAVETEVVEAGAERLPFADASFDSVVSTLVLCTVDDQAEALAEVARVLRPGGRLLLFEHVRHPGEGGRARWQDRLERPWGWFAGGCHPNRDTLAALRAAGYDVAAVGDDKLPGAPPLVRPAISGSASPPSG
jgi:ubiquinone/menaquinone biosynthesis C-methylase UbiE